MLLDHFTPQVIRHPFNAVFEKLLQLFFNLKKETNIPNESIGGWRLNLPAKHCYTFERAGEAVTASIEKVDDNFAYVDINGKSFFYTFETDPLDISIEESMTYYYGWDTKVENDFVSLHYFGNFVQIPLYNPANELLSSGANALTAPMPGKIIAVKAAVGDAVKAGDPLIIMEAMKMEMTLEAPRDGVVAEVTAVVDALVTDGEMLLALEEV